MQRTDLKNVRVGKKAAAGFHIRCGCKDGQATMSHHGTMHQAAELFIPHPVVQFSPSSPAKDCLGTASKAGASHQPSQINFKSKCAACAIALLCKSFCQKLPLELLDIS